MNPKVFLGLALALFVVVEVSGHSCSSCGLTAGVDGVCGCSPRIVRPVPLPKISTQDRVVCRKYGVPELKPVGDICGCRNIVVQPAYLPRPKGSKVSSECEYETYSAGDYPVVSDLVPAPCHMQDFDDQTEQLVPSNRAIDTTMPIDAVSWNLVNRMMQQSAMALPEERIAYGFNKIPKEAPVIASYKNVPEEDLVAFDKQIVELRKPTNVVKCGSTGEEITVEDKDQPMAYLSYKDLGFVPEAGYKPEFQKKTCRYHNNYSGEVVGKCACDDGFVPGAVRHCSDYVEPKTQSYDEVYDDEVQPGNLFMKKIYGCACN